VAKSTAVDDFHELAGVTGAMRGATSIQEARNARHCALRPCCRRSNHYHLRHRPGRDHCRTGISRSGHYTIRRPDVAERPRQRNPGELRGHECHRE
jgi:hypothetical protein